MPRFSDRMVAEQCGVSDKTVASVRKEISASSENPKIRTVTRGGRTYQQNTSRIGRKRRAPAAPAPAAPAPAAPAPAPATQRSLFPAEVIEDATPQTACAPAARAGRVRRSKKAQIAANTWLFTVEHELSHLAAIARQSQLAEATDQPAAAVELWQKVCALLSALTAWEPEFLTAAGRSNNTPEDARSDAP
jgi:hypothetical protein